MKGLVARTAQLVIYIPVFKEMRVRVRAFARGPFKQNVCARTESERIVMTLRAARNSKMLLRREITDRA